MNILDKLNEQQKSNSKIKDAEDAMNITKDEWLTKIKEVIDHVHLIVVNYLLF